MFLRDNKWMKTWTQFVPYCVIFVCLGFILGVLSDLIVPGWTPSSVPVPRTIVTNILVSTFLKHPHQYHSLYHEIVFLTRRAQ